MARLDLSIEIPDGGLALKQGKLPINESAEAQIMKALAFKRAIERVIDQMKAHLVEEGRKFSPEFKGFVGDDIKGYIKRGEKYKKLEGATIEDGLLREITYKKLDQDAVEAYVKENGKLPKGVDAVSENEVTSFVLQYDKQAVEEASFQFFAGNSLEAGKA